MAWTEQQQAELVRLAGEGLTGSEIGARLGFSRSAVLGRAHRTGVKLPLNDAKREGMVVRGLAAFDALRADPAHRARMSALLSATWRENAEFRARHRQAVAKLCAADVQTVRAAIARGRRDEEIGAVYGVSAATIRDIRLGRTWKDIPAKRTPADAESVSA